MTNPVPLPQVANAASGQNASIANVRAEEAGSADEPARAPRCRSAGRPGQQPGPPRLGQAAATSSFCASRKRPTRRPLSRRRARTGQPARPEQYFSAAPATASATTGIFSAFVYAWGQFLDHDHRPDRDANPQGKPSRSRYRPEGDAWFDPANSGAMTIPLSRSAYDPASGGERPAPAGQFDHGFHRRFPDLRRGWRPRCRAARVSRRAHENRRRRPAALQFPRNSPAPTMPTAWTMPNYSWPGDIRANENPELISLHTAFPAASTLALRRKCRAGIRPGPTSQVFPAARRVGDRRAAGYHLQRIPARAARVARAADYRGYRPGRQPRHRHRVLQRRVPRGDSMVGADVDIPR